jgi:hypothetical protein
MSHTPTREQARIVDGFLTGQNLVIEAGAGTGKTSTLKMLAGEPRRRRGVYIAYNRHRRRRRQGLPRHGAVQDRPRPGVRGGRPRYRTGSTAPGSGRGHRPDPADQRPGPARPTRRRSRRSSWPGSSWRPCSGSATPPTSIAAAARAAGQRRRHPAERAELAGTWCRSRSAPGTRTSPASTGSSASPTTPTSSCGSCRPQLPPTTCSSMRRRTPTRPSPPSSTTRTPSGSSSGTGPGHLRLARRGRRHAHLRRPTRFQLSRVFRFGPAIADEANKWLTVLTRRCA